MAKNQNKIQIKRNIPKVSDKYEQFQEEQIKYWTERMEKIFLAGEKDALQVVKELKLNYEKCVQEIEKEINAFYGKYASQNGLTLEEAKQLLDKTELKSFKQGLKEILQFGKNKDFTENQLSEYKKLYMKTKITRLEELQANIKYELDKLSVITEDKLEQLLYNTYEQGYYETLDVIKEFNNKSTPFTGIDKQSIYKAIKTKYLSENYSTLIWKNEEKLLQILTQEIPRGITLGYNPRKLSRQIISKRIDKIAYNNTVRLVRTEYSKVLNDATLAGYKASKVEKYRILATLEQMDRTCEYCTELDYRNSGKAININEAETGVNYPPFHPNCRCTTIPYFEPDEFDKMTDEELAKYVENLDTLGWLKAVVNKKKEV